MVTRWLHGGHTSIVALQVPALTNMLLGTSAGVITKFADLQKHHVRGFVTIALTVGEAAKFDATLKLRATCGVMHNAERATTLLDQVLHRCVTAV